MNFARWRELADRVISGRGSQADEDALAESVKQDTERILAELNFPDLDDAVQEHPKETLGLAAAMKSVRSETGIPRDVFGRMVVLVGIGIIASHSRINEAQNN